MLSCVSGGTSRKREEKEDGRMHLPSDETAEETAVLSTCHLLSDISLVKKKTFLDFLDSLHKVQIER